MVAVVVDPQQVMVDLQQVVVVARYFLHSSATVLFFSSPLTSFPFHVTAAAAAAETLTFSSLEG